MNIEPVVAEVVARHARACGGKMSGVPDRSTVLADTGLDSLGFASVMVELYKALGHDPFADADEIYYPDTLGELIDLYQNGE